MDLNDNIDLHPTPQFARKSWMSLCGEWDFRFDQNNTGETEMFFRGFERENAIIVPFTYESKASGIGKEEACQSVWYQRRFSWKKNRAKHAHIIFEGADYLTKVWINGQYVGSNIGAYHAFSFDIDFATHDGENLIVVKCEDSYSPTILRGKQRTTEKNHDCFYVQMTGIWKPVWLEYRSHTYLDSVRYSTDIKRKTLGIHFIVKNVTKEIQLQTEISLNGNVVVTSEEKIFCEEGDIAVCFMRRGVKNCFWGLNGGLYDIVLRIKHGEEIIDEVFSYFGMREISVRGNAVCLNNTILHQKLILYQGIWKDRLYSDPDDETIVKELTSIKNLGFNGIRVHEKIESERFLYFADRMGLLVWCEIPSAYENTPVMQENYIREMPVILKQKANHPCIITWVLFNESWGIGEIGVDKNIRRFADAMYYLAKSVDETRPVIVNDGWEHTLCDILTIHNYAQSAEELYTSCEDACRDPDSTQCAAKKRLFVKGYQYRGQPVIVSEFGGCAFDADTGNGWGYGASVHDSADFLKRMSDLYTALYKNRGLSGNCYTQFCDVQQEKNGLFTADGKLKADAVKIKKILDKE